MADAPFDITVINPKERPLSTDINQAESQLYRALRFAFRKMLAARASDSSPAGLDRTTFVGDGLMVVPDSPIAMSVTVNQGLAWFQDAADVPSSIPGSGADPVTGLSDLDPFKPIFLLADHAFAVPVAPAGPNTRIDIIEVRADRRLENPLSRDVLNTTTGVFNPTAVDKTLAFALDGRTGQVTTPTDSSAGLSYKIGAPANPGVAPATTTGYVKIAEILVGSGVTTIDKDALVDRRVLAGEGGLVRVSAQFQLDWNAGVPTVTMRNIIAPPGTEIGVEPSAGQKGEATIFVLGGEMAKIVERIDVSANSILGVAQIVTAHLQASAAASSVLKAVIASDQVQMAAATPALKAGLGQMAAEQVIQARFQSGATTDVTNVALEDLEYHYEAILGY